MQAILDQALERGVRDSGPGARDSGLGLPTSDIRHPTSDFGLRTSDLGLGTPSPQSPAPNPQHPAPNWETLGCELAAEVLRSWGKLRLRVTGASMLPALWPGDLLLVHSDDAAKALPGDVVVFRREGRLVTHRVVEVRTAKSEARSPRSEVQGRKSEVPIEFVTRGDRVRRNDAPISSHELLGRVTAIERGARRLTPRQTFWGKIGASILSRSDFCTRVALKLGG